MAAGHEGHASLAKGDAVGDGVPEPVMLFDGVSVCVALLDGVTEGVSDGVPLPVPDGVGVAAGELDSDGVVLSDLVEVGVNCH